MLTKAPKGYRFPAQIIHHCVYLYHRFSLSYRDIEEMMAKRGIRVSYESIRKWCLKFSRQYAFVLRKREHKRIDKWHLDEMTLKINGVPYLLWRAVDSEAMNSISLSKNARIKNRPFAFLSGY